MLWKLLVIFGLGMTFAGLILMIEAYIYRTKTNGEKIVASSIGVVKRWMKILAWILTIAGYVLQIIGVILSPA